MSELTPDQLSEIRSALELLQQQLRAALLGSGEAAKPVSLDDPIGRLSRMDAIQQQQMAKSTRGRSEERLRLVDAALLRLGTESYGICGSCEEPIEFARLLIRPEATLCLKCQSAREQK